MPTFKMMRYVFPGCLWGPVRCFSVVERLKSHQKSWPWSLWMFAMPRFQPRKETHLWAKAYLYASNLEALFSLFSCMRAAFFHLNGLLTWVGAYGQRQVDTHFSRNNFNKPGMHPVYNLQAIGYDPYCL